MTRDEAIAKATETLRIFSFGDGIGASWLVEVVADALLAAHAAGREAAAKECDRWLIGLKEFTRSSLFSRETLNQILDEMRASAALARDGAMG